MSTELCIAADLQEFSPRFYIYYEAAQQMREHKIHESAIGAVLRVSLECIVTDYAIGYVHDLRENVLKKTLHGRIETYLAGMPAALSEARIAKLIGNDSCHYDCKYDPADVYNMQIFLDDVCRYIHCRLKASIGEDRVKEYEARLAKEKSNETASPVG